MRAVLDAVERVAPASAVGADPRRVGHRQGAGGAAHPRPLGAGARGRSWPSTARPSPTRWSRASSSAIAAAPSPARTATARASSGRRTAAPCSSTRSATWRSRPRPSSCACSRRGRSSRWAAASRCAVDVRVLAATHRDLKALAAEGRFREDLLFRLRVVEIELPPLRERSGDVLLLARHFLAASRARRSAFAPEAERALLAYPWPGNVRELANALERAAIFCRDWLVASRRPAAGGADAAAPAGDRRRPPGLGSGATTSPPPRRRSSIASSARSSPPPCAKPAATSPRPPAGSACTARTSSRSCTSWGSRRRGPGAARLRALQAINASRPRRNPDLIAYSIF